MKYDCMIPIYLVQKQAVLIHGDRSQKSGCLLGQGRGHEGTFQGDGKILYLDLSGVHTGVYSCQNSSNRTPKICAVYRL